MKHRFVVFRIVSRPGAVGVLNLCIRIRERVEKCCDNTVDRFRCVTSVSIRPEGNCLCTQCTDALHDLRVFYVSQIRPFDGGQESCVVTNCQSNSAKIDIPGSVIAMKTI